MEVISETQSSYRSISCWLQIPSEKKDWWTVKKFKKLSPSLRINSKHHHFKHLSRTYHNGKKRKKLSKKITFSAFNIIVTLLQVQQITSFGKGKDEKKEEEGKYSMLILDVSIMHGNATGETLTQHSALKGHSAGLHSAQLLCWSSGVLSLF